MGAQKWFWDIPWIWCSLLNFGGKIGMYSRMDQLATEPARALKSDYGKKLSGIGMMMEGDKTNPVNFELTFDAAWSAEAIVTRIMDTWIRPFTLWKTETKRLNRPGKF